MSKRELIEPTEGDKRYVRRNEKGEFTKVDDLHRSLSRDDRKNSKVTSAPGQGDRGDGHTGSRATPAKKK
ncbi:hypothetical protein [Hymenobacter wooponensis]|uniref:Uncharacterized protein n=1 Tax=Hymenobacter wooponensis TaxID=1525360 RepID=A0A4Z0MLE6_9BACT|nr:hypothetical protein [Hymenobacter wooponensis]TGD80249.1 hypothetical protein EU557_10405 [Hymenobacter wooponensis]